MLTRPIAAALIASVWFSCLPPAQAQQTTVLTVTVPAGTFVPLTLVNPIKNKSTQPGDTVRAVVAFPVTIGDQVAIPAGTFVDGILAPPAPKVKHRPDPGVQIHFTQLVYANGYSVALDATQASLTALPPSGSDPTPTALAIASLPASSLVLRPTGALQALSAVLPKTLRGTFASLVQLATPGTLGHFSLIGPQVAEPTNPTLPHVGPSAGTIVGIMVGALALPVVLAIIFHHKAGSSDFIVHDAGWQFQMKLDAPLTLDTSQIAPGNVK